MPVRYLSDPELCPAEQLAGRDRPSRDAVTHFTLSTDDFCRGWAGLQQPPAQPPSAVAVQLVDACHGWGWIFPTDPGPGGPPHSHSTVLAQALGIAPG